MNKLTFYNVPFMYIYIHIYIYIYVYKHVLYMCFRDARVE